MRFLLILWSSLVYRPTESPRGACVAYNVVPGAGYGAWADTGLAKTALGD